MKRLFLLPIFDAILRNSAMLKEQIFSISSSEDFLAAALATFRFQYTHTVPYRKYCDLLGVNPKVVDKLEDIPFLPITFFKTYSVIPEGQTATTIFTSSGTTGSTTSKHYITDESLYRESFRSTFKQYYGDPKDLTILALLPSYLERTGSSLVYMVDNLIGASENLNSGFYLDQLDTLAKKLQALDQQNKKVLLIGVSYALLDLIETHNFQLKNTIVMETGGMKGKRKEMIKEELHAVLKRGFGVSTIHSEYGMTEMLSQAYSKGNGLFTCPSWLKILTRDPEDALTLVQGKTGGINVIDLANLNSCSFIATQDLGKAHPNGSFEILGRFDTSDIRGCNLMVD